MAGQLSCIDTGLYLCCSGSRQSDGKHPDLSELRPKCFLSKRFIYDLGSSIRQNKLNSMSAYVVMDVACSY